MKPKHLFSKGVLVAAAAALATLGQFARAEDATSTSYTVRGGGAAVEGGVATSTSFTSFSGGDTLLSGVATTASFKTPPAGPLGGESLASFASGAWRFYRDEGSETPADPIAGENVAPPALWTDDPVKLRITVIENAEAGSLAKFRLQYSDSGDFSGAVYDVLEAGQCVASSTFCYVNAAGADNATITAKTLSDADACAGGVGAGCGTYNESGTTTPMVVHQSGAAAEYEFTIKSMEGVVMQTVYFFRLLDTVNGTYVRLAPSASYPSVVTAGAELTFTVAGLPLGTTTEGVTTDVATNANAVSFGELPLGSDRKAAQRLSIVTNARAGYQVLVYSRQGLVNTYGDVIPSVAATNASPDAWGIGCDAGATGCFGYHAGDDSLEGGSNRFAPDDTYAALDTVAREVAYSPVRAVSDVVDVVFRAVAQSLQPAGIYESEVVYIMTPVF